MPTATGQSKMPYHPQFVDVVVIDPETTPFKDVLRIQLERAVGYSRDMMEGAEGPYASKDEYMSVLAAMCSESRVRVPHDPGPCRIINRKMTLEHFLASCHNCHRVLKYDPALKTCPYCGKPASTVIPNTTDGGWLEVPRPFVAELIRTQYLKIFTKEREFDRIGWREMGWDGDIANWYGWPS